MTYLSAIFSGATQQFAQKFPNGYNNLCALTEKISLIGKDLFRADLPISREKVLPFLSLHKGKLAALVAFLAAGYILYRRPSSPASNPEPKQFKSETSKTDETMPALVEPTKQQSDTVESAASSSKSRKKKARDPSAKIKDQIKTAVSRLPELKNKKEVAENKLNKLKTTADFYNLTINSIHQLLRNTSQRINIRNVNSRIKALKVDTEKKLESQSDPKVQKELQELIDICQKHLNGKVDFDKKINETTQELSSLSNAIKDLEVKVSELEERNSEGKPWTQFFALEKERDIAKEQLKRFIRLQGHYLQIVNVTTVGDKQNVMGIGIMQHGKASAWQSQNLKEMEAAQNRFTSGGGDFEGAIELATEKFKALAQKCVDLKKELEAQSL